MKVFEKINGYRIFAYYDNKDIVFCKSDPRDKITTVDRIISDLYESAIERILEFSDKLKEKPYTQYGFLFLYEGSGPCIKYENLDSLILSDCITLSENLNKKRYYSNEMLISESERLGVPCIKPLDISIEDINKNLLTEQIEGYVLEENGKRVALNSNYYESRLNEERTENRQIYDILVKDILSHYTNLTYKEIDKLNESNDYLGFCDNLYLSYIGKASDKINYSIVEHIVPAYNKTKVTFPLIKNIKIYYSLFESELNQAVYRVIVNLFRKNRKYVNDSLISLSENLLINAIHERWACLNTLEPINEKESKSADDIADEIVNKAVKSSEKKADDVVAANDIVDTAVKSAEKKGEDAIKDEPKTNVSKENDNDKIQKTLYFDKMFKLLHNDTNVGNAICFITTMTPCITKKEIEILQTLKKEGEDRKVILMVLPKNIKPEFPIYSKELISQFVRSIKNFTIDFVDEIIPLQTDELEVILKELSDRELICDKFYGSAQLLDNLSFQLKGYNKEIFTNIKFNMNFIHIDTDIQNIHNSLITNDFVMFKTFAPEQMYGLYDNLVTSYLKK